MLDVSREHLQIIKDVLNKYLTANEVVWAFGSRVSGASKKYSDLDLVIIGDTSVPVLTMALIKEAFSTSDLPYKVDLLDWHLIEDDFRKIILSNQILVFGSRKK